MKTKTLKTAAFVEIGLTFLILILSFLSSQIFSQKQEYNILLIMSDDMNDRISFLGNAEVNSPNIQRIVDHGMVFTMAYAQYPLCSPSRTSLLSGWRPERTQIFNNDIRPSTVMDTNVLYLPGLFHQFGYRTERYGKINHDLYENDISWDYAEPKERRDGENTVNNPLLLTTSAKTVYYGADWWIRNAPDSITYDGNIAQHLKTRMQQPQTFPFFYGLGFANPHDPFTPSIPYWNMNGDPSVQEYLPIDEKGTLSSDIIGNGSSNILLPSTPLNEPGVPPIAFTGKGKKFADSSWKKIIHAYDGEVSQMDAQIGIVLDELDRQNLWSNTIVVFVSDHGQHLGEHAGQWLKMTLFEESLHVPLIVCVPGKNPGVCNRLVELVDLYPTLAELCGLPLPQGLEGSSFARLFDIPGRLWKKAAFSEVEREGIAMGRSVRTKQYRYTSWADAGEELYDHLSDPHEYTNLASDPSHAAALRSMQKILREGWTQSLPPLCKDIVCYRDADGDGFGSVTDSIFNCTVLPGYITITGDFNDADTSIYPGAKERCNNIDDNCNGQIDENVVPDKAFFRDADGDGYGNSQHSVFACSAPEGFVSVGVDCDDSNATVYPGAPEVLNGKDDNCNGVVDEKNIYYADSDKDGYGNAKSFVRRAVKPQGYVNNKLDCDDQDPLKNPGATEILNTIDDNCNGLIDEGLTSLNFYYRDADGDGYGNAGKVIFAASIPPGYITNSNDCNDTNPFMNPDAPDLCNGIDDNCDGIIDENTFTAGINPPGTYRFCSHDSGQLTATSTTANKLTYKWYNNDDSVTGGANQTPSITTTGNYYVIESDNLYCNSTSPVTTVTTWPLPSATISYTSLDICDSASVVLSANYGSGLTYQWMKNGVNIRGAVKRKYIAKSTGTYNVNETNLYGCSTLSAGVTVINSCGTIAAYASLDAANTAAESPTLLVYPNPSKGKFKLMYNSPDACKIQMNVYDVSGRKIFSTTDAAVKGENIFSPDLRSLSQGMYHLELINNTSRLNKRISIVK